MNFDAFAAKYPDEFTALAPLLQLQKESNPQEINGKLRGAIKGRLVEVLGQDDGRYFLKTLWDIEDGSTTKLSQTQGNFLGLWLRTDGNEKALPGIVDAMRVFEGMQASEQISAERKAESETEIQRVAKEIGATINELNIETGETGWADLDTVATDLERTVDEEATVARLPEAPASFNFFASIRGFSGQFTLRGWDEGRLLRRAYALIMGLEELGVFPTDRYGNQIVTVSNASTIAEAKGTPVTSQPAQKAAPRQSQEDTSGVTLMPGEQAMRVIKIEVHTTKKGDPALHLFGPGREFADLYYNFGIDSFLTTCPLMRGDHAANAQVFQESDLMPTLEDGKVVMPVYAGNWIAVWVESEKLNTKGFPYKNVSRMYPAQGGNSGD